MSTLQIQGVGGIMSNYSKMSRGDFVRGRGDIVRISPFMLTLAKMQNDSTFT